MSRNAEEEQTFLNTLNSYNNFISVYENEEFYEVAKEVIPVKRLEDEAKQQASCSDEVKDLFITQLLRWFKLEYFSWFNPPRCHSDINMTNGILTDDDRCWMATRVEEYVCRSWGNTDRFPRYNHPLKLMDTTRGRCGEWANCFTFFCRALGYKARFVLDQTDHVWTEVYSERLARWIHADSCENSYDSPLLYEQGWGKKLNYCIAFSHEEVQDVTWRYVSDFDATLSRRNLVTEEWLFKQINKINRGKRKSMSQECLEQLDFRRVMELATFLTPPKVSDKNLGGRTSGDAEWIKSRGEDGLNVTSHYTFSLTEGELRNKLLHIEFCNKRNCYIRCSDGDAISRGWQTLAHKAHNMFRKEELDWKMVYLARKDGSTEGSIEWKFDFTNSSVVIDSVDLVLGSACYENGRVIWTLCSGDTCVKLKDGESVCKEFSGCCCLTLKAQLDRGSGSCAYQHAQIFRQSLIQNENPSFTIKITFNQKHS